MLIKYLLYAKHSARSWGCKKVYNKTVHFKKLNVSGETGYMQEKIAHDKQQMLAADNC